MGQMYFPGELENDCSAEIEKIWIEHNESEYGEKGMRIHVACDIHGLQNKQVNLSVYFYYATDNPIIDTNNKYCTSDGHVATNRYVTPPYDNCHYSDLSIFMPYKEFHIFHECTCYFYILIWNGETKIGTSKKVGFYLGYG